nr:hypothetical protein [Bacteroidota bacterium]
LLLSFDFKPAIHFNYEDWLTPSTAFSLRYVFVKEKKTGGGLFKGIFKKDKEEEEDDEKGKEDE